MSAITAAPHTHRPPHAPPTAKPSSTRNTVAATAAIALSLLLAPTPCRAAYISEVFLDDGQGEAGMPHAVELTNLQAVAADAVDLLVVDAQPDRFGEIRHVLSIPTDRELRLVSERDWPDELWGRDPLQGGSSQRADELGEMTTLSFVNARTLLLYDRPTGLSHLTPEPLFSDEGQDLLGQAEQLDALTFTFPGETAHEAAPGQRFAVDAGHAIVRPLDTQTTPHERRWADRVTAAGELDSPVPPLAVTPGVKNPTWQPIPEPATATWLLIALALLLPARPCRRCSHRPRCLSWKVSAG